MKNKLILIAAIRKILEIFDESLPSCSVQLQTEVESKLLEVEGARAAMTHSWRRRGATVC